MKCDEEDFINLFTKYQFPTNIYFFVLNNFLQILINLYAAPDMVLFIYILKITYKRCYPKKPSLTFTKKKRCIQRNILGDFCEEVSLGQEDAFFYY
jgi:hypothetical protein